MNQFESNVLATIKNYNMLNPNSTIVAGLSGGADSVALVLCLKNLGYNVRAVHVNHMIRGDEADRDEMFVTNLCDHLKLPLDVFKKDIPKIAQKEGISQEVAGRNVRYECFYKVAKKYNIKSVAVAHNLDDNLETMLFNLLRGSGLKGIAGIPPVNDMIIRPLINTSRSDIEGYLKDNNYSYVTDSTNLTPIYTRNIIRQSIIPHFKNVNSAFLKNAKKCSDIIREEDAYLDSLADEYIQKHSKIYNNEIMLSIIHDVNDIILRRVIYKCINMIDNDKHQIAYKYIKSIMQLDSNGKKFILGNGLTVTKKYDILHFESSLTKYDNYSYSIQSYESFYIQEAGLFIDVNVLNANDITEFDSQYSYLDIDKLGSLSVRNRRVGDRFMPSGMKNNKKLKDYFSDVKLDSDLRDIVPILISDSRIAAVIGMRTDDKYLIDDSTKYVLKIGWRKKCN